MSPTAAEYTRPISPPSQHNTTPVFPTSCGPNFADKDPSSGVGFDFSNNGDFIRRSYSSTSFNGGGFVFGAKNDKSASDFGKKTSTNGSSSYKVLLSKLIEDMEGLNINSDIAKAEVVGSNGDFSGKENQTFDCRDFNKESFSFASSEFGVKFEFCASNNGATDDRMKKTRGKPRQRVQTKPVKEQDQVSFKSPMDFSHHGNATENVPGSSGTSIAAEKKKEENSKQTSGNNQSCVKPEKQDTKSKPPEQVTRDRPKKKYKLKVGSALSGKTPAQFSSNAQKSPQAVKGSAEWESEGLYSECERWRMRGSQAYKNGDMSKAEEFYTNGINCVRQKIVEGFYCKSLVLCYNNRAATRMSLGSLREALEDCKFAASLHPAFLRAKLRAANCHLLLGELEEAIQYYKDCLEDTKIVIDASEGLQKAQQVSDSLCQSAIILQQTNSDAATSALKEINKGLSISCYSERLLEMRGQSLLLLRRYNEVIDLCEKSLPIAEKNFKNSTRQWRWCLMSKCQFHMGRLEAAMELIERLESFSHLAATVRELLHRKKAGNEAFQSGKHVEAVEHYTAAISSSLEFDSRPFAAICYYNRAAAHQALGLVADAIADCSVAIALDGDYVKAVRRRATLHESIRDYKQAITDLQKTLPLLGKCAQQELNRRVTLMEVKTKHEEAPMNFYLILGIKASDSESDVKKAYKRAALKHHPDKACQYLARMNNGESWKEIVENVHEDAERLFKMIGEAYAVLSDADKRSKYDSEEQIRNGLSNRHPHSAGRSSGYDYDHSPYEKHQNFGSSSRSTHESRYRRYQQESWRNDRW